MFGKIKKFAIRKLIASQIKNLPKDQQEMVLNMVEQKPELFEKIAKEMQEELKKNGNNQMAAAMKVLPKYQSELREVMGDKMPQPSGTQFNPNGSIRK